jgi:drug/metabolite transporter (DMT)-like permease
MPTWLKFAVATLIWGSTWIVIKSQLTYVPANWGVCYRMTVAAFFCILWALATNAFRALSWRTHSLLLLFGMFQFGWNFIFIYEAEKHVPAGLVAVGFSMMVIGNPLMGRLILRQPITPTVLVAALVGVAGVGCLFWPEVRTVHFEDTAVLAFGMVLLGVLSASTGNLFPLFKSLRGLPSASMNAWGMVYGAILTGFYASIFSGPPVFSADAEFLVGLLYLGLFGSVVTFGFYLDVIRAWGMARSAYAAVLTPVIALAISTVVEGYRWTPLAGFGAALALAGALMAIITLNHRRA